jgi:hypothetical protein
MERGALSPGEKKNKLAVSLPDKKDSCCKKGKTRIRKPKSPRQMGPSGTELLLTASASTRSAPEFARLVVTTAALLKG